MPRPQHGPPCGLFINNACECIYIHKQWGGGRRGNRDAVSDLHMANKTVSHFGQLQSQNGWQRAQAAAEEEEEKPKSRRQQNKTKRCTQRESQSVCGGEKGNWQLTAKHFDGAAKYAMKFLTLDETVPVFGDCRTEGTADYSWHLWCDNCDMEELFW